MPIFFKIEGYKNNGTMLKYKVFKLKNCGSNMFRPFLMGQPQGGCINIYIKRKL